MLGRRLCVSWTVCILIVFITFVLRFLIRRALVSIVRFWFCRRRRVRFFSSVFSSGSCGAFDASVVRGVSFVLCVGRSRGFVCFRRWLVEGFRLFIF